MKFIIDVVLIRVCEKVLINQSINNVRSKAG